MKAILFFVSFISSSILYAQSPNFSRIFNLVTPEDTGYILVEVRAVDVLSWDRPDPVLKRSGNGLLYEQKEERVRQEVQGSLFIGVFPRREVQSRYQPHLFMEVFASDTYLASRFGAGVTDRAQRWSAGFTAGKYFRRRPGISDVQFRKLNLETGLAVGVYGAVEVGKLSTFVSLAKEAKELYHRVYFSFEPSSLIPSPDGLMLSLLSESFLGTGPGIRYCTPNGKFDLCLSYRIPEPWEEREQARMNNFIGRGTAIELAYRWF